MPPDDTETDRLVELIAAGQAPQQIAEELGLDAGEVLRIARGQARPELQAEIRAAAAGHIDAARQLGARWMRPLLSRHIRIGMQEDGETSRKCREFVLTTFHKAVGSPSDDLPAPTDALDPTDPPSLTHDDLEALARTDDGPDP